MGQYRCLILVKDSSAAPVFVYTLKELLLKRNVETSYRFLCATRLGFLFLSSLLLLEH